MLIANRCHKHAIMTVLCGAMAQARKAKACRRTEHLDLDALMMVWSQHLAGPIAHILQTMLRAKLSQCQLRLILIQGYKETPFLCR